VEGNENGGFLPNRTFDMGSADTLEVVILSWEDTGGTTHTAAENVVVMDEEFYMPQLDRHRRICLYMPPDYESSGLDYPVLYMHDGQNLFDVATSFAGEWEVDETLNALFAEGKAVPIVVGIDNGGGDRIGEYTPWPNPQYGGGDGDLYARFIVETLKPYIDANYRTKSNRENTGVMGSSLGGLISHYIGIKYQDIFSKAGVFSPSYWFNDSVYDFTFLSGKQHDMRINIMGGDDESGGLITQMNVMIDTLQAAGFSQDELKLKVVPGGQHNEALWRSQFGEAYQWLFLDDASSIAPGKSGIESPIHIKDGKLQFNKTINLNNPARLRIFSISGQKVMDKNIDATQNVALPKSLSGIYVIGINYDNEYYSTKAILH
jgi:predicted alpha/beta superfamily hydrolase